MSVYKVQTAFSKSIKLFVSVASKEYTLQKCNKGYEWQVKVYSRRAGSGYP